MESIDREKKRWRNVERGRVEKSGRGGREGKVGKDIHRGEIERNSDRDRVRKKESEI